MGEVPKKVTSSFVQNLARIFCNASWTQLVEGLFLGAKQAGGNRTEASHALVDRTMWNKAFGLLFRRLLSRSSLIYDIQIQKEKDSTYL